MTFFRKQEMQYLESAFSHSENEIIVLYGAKDVGMTDLVKQFCKGKDYFYFRARSCSNSEQIYRFGMEIRDELPKGTAEIGTWSAFVDNLLSVKCEKRLVVVENFPLIVRGDSDFMAEIVKSVHNKWNNQPVMFLLCASSPYWVEKTMVQKLKEDAFEISGLLRLNELKFLDMVRHFKKYKVLSSIETYAVLGGFSDLWSLWDDEKKVMDNICDLVLKKGGALYERGMHILPEELREPAVYNTLLMTLAEGRQKLNEIHKHTGFSRAKVSVYLKNLIELDFIEKVDSYDTPGRDNAQKGIYRISNRFAAFWFRYIYSNLSKLDIMEPQKFCKKYIEPNFKEYVSECFKSVCTEYLYLMNQMGQLEFRFTKLGVWVGKVGTIDIVAQNQHGNTLVGLCNYEKNVMSYDDFEWLRFCTEQAKIYPEYYYLFSAGTFDEKLTLEAKMSENIYLIDSTML